MTRICACLCSSAALMGSFLLAAESAIKFPALENLERSFGRKLTTNPGKYPFEILANAPAVYVPGNGVTLINYVNLIYPTQDSPFRPIPSPEQILANRSALREHKLEKIPILEQNMREYLSDAAASPDLDAVRPNEQLVIGVALLYFPQEDTTGLPHQITMSAAKQKLLEARRGKIDLTAVIVEQKL